MFLATNEGHYHIRTRTHRTLKYLKTILIPESITSESFIYLLPISVNFTINLTNSNFSSDFFKSTSFPINSIKTNIHPQPSPTLINICVKLNGRNKNLAKSDCYERLLFWEVSNIMHFCHIITAITDLVTKLTEEIKILFSLELTS